MKFFLISFDLGFDRSDLHLKIFDGLIFKLI